MTSTASVAALRIARTRRKQTRAMRRGPVGDGAQIQAPGRGLPSVAGTEAQKGFTMRTSMRQIRRRGKSPSGLTR
jgi:hypothetical protein